MKGVRCFIAQRKIIMEDLEKYFLFYQRQALETPLNTFSLCICRSYHGKVITLFAQTHYYVKLSS